ncbi:MAG TPA: zinc ribbon domain-containing protein, partial [Acidimicrobiales bacterium]|nr:zinc ribbon domain-containing protein [Acidimicrobiales bacterium]
IARCGRCSGPLWAGWRKNRGGVKVPRYACVSRPGARGCGKLGVVGPPLDELVREAVLHALAGPKLAKARRQAAGKDRDLARAAAELAAAEAKLEDLALDYAQDRMTKREWLTQRSALTERIDTAQRVLDRDAGPLAGLPDTNTALRDAWDAGDVQWRRALLGAVVEAVTVSPAGPSKTFDPERVAITWRA